MDKARKDTFAGLVLIAFGLAFAIGATNYDLGVVSRMGPGYVPLALGCILVAIGILTIVEGVLRAEGSPIGPVPWRAIVLLIGAVLFFAFTVRRLGLVPAIFVSAIMAAFSSTRTTVIQALVIALALTVFCVLIFVEALGLPIRLFPAWLAI
jgi:hypothetical protein